MSTFSLSLNLRRSKETVISVNVFLMPIAQYIAHLIDFSFRNCSDLSFSYHLANLHCTQLFKSSWNNCLFLIPGHTTHWCPMLFASPFSMSWFSGLLICANI